MLFENWGTRLAIANIDHAYGIDRCILVIKHIIRHSIARYSCLIVKLALPDVFPVSCCLRVFHKLYTFAEHGYYLGSPHPKTDTNEGS